MVSLRRRLSHIRHSSPKRWSDYIEDSDIAMPYTAVAADDATSLASDATLPRKVSVSDSSRCPPLCSSSMRRISVSRATATNSLVDGTRPWNWACRNAARARPRTSASMFKLSCTLPLARSLRGSDAWHILDPCEHLYRRLIARRSVTDEQFPATEFALCAMGANRVRVIP